MTFDINEFKNNPERKIGIVIYGHNEEKPILITETLPSLDDTLVINTSHIDVWKDRYAIVEEKGNIQKNGEDYGKLVFLHDKISIEQFAEKLFSLGVDEAIDFSFDEERGPEWGAKKIEAFDSAQIIIGAYGGLESGIFPLQGESDSLQLLEFLKCELQDHLGDFLYPDYVSRP